jgi:hypothetical protein
VQRFGHDEPKMDFSDLNRGQSAPDVIDLFAREGYLASPTLRHHF